MSQISSNDASMSDLALFGDGILAYIKPISASDAQEIIGDAGEIPQGMELFCLFSANGTPLAISDSPQTAFENAVDHDLKPVYLQ